MQGFFFQRRTSFGVDIVAIKGAVAVIREGMFRDMFSGLFGLDESGEWSGTILDTFGTSTMSDISLVEDRLTFNKRYDDDGNIIHYEFRLTYDGLWVGSYSSDNVGTGAATCILTPVPKRMLKLAQ